MSVFISLPVQIIWEVLKGVYKFAKWFYFTFLPFMLQYIAIPLFILGIILAVAFAGGTLLFTILFFIVMYFFIKGTIFTSNPIK